MKRIAALVFSLAGLALAFFEFRVEISAATGIPLEYLDLGIYFFLGGILVTGVIWIIHGLTAPLKTRIDKLEERLADRYLVELATEDDLSMIDSLSSQAFGLVASNLQQIRQLYEVNSDTFWKIVDRKSDETVGYFCILWLTSEGERQIEKQIFNGPCPDPKALQTIARSGCPAYIGAVYARGARARGVALAALTVHLKVKRSKRLYAKAATDDGIRVLKKYGFRLLSPGADQVGKYYVRAC
ncbi:MAG: hypothetical protein VX444_03580 [Pseudomonadota bacterium]|nr:hypothetical protein [Pseudomonadota bacterium]